MLDRHACRLRWPAAITYAHINGWGTSIGTIVENTIDRATALPSLRAVPARRLREIAERVKTRDIPADVFGATR